VIVDRYLVHNEVPVHGNPDAGPGRGPGVGGVDVVRSIRHSAPVNLTGRLAGHGPGGRADLDRARGEQAATLLAQFGPPGW
jgi:hypothetical protein